MAGKAAGIKITGSPVTLSLTDGVGAFANWDVDGDLSTDFQLINTIQGSLTLNSYGYFFGYNGRGLVGANTSFGDVKPLNTSFRVGPTLATGFGWSPPTTSSGTYRPILNPYGNIAPDFALFSQGDNYFGFRFLIGTNLHYGYGVMNINSNTKSVTISRWAYESDPDTEIHVEPFTSAAAVPGPMGIAGLAAGAAWVRRLRRRVNASM